MRAARGEVRGGALGSGGVRWGRVGESCLSPQPLGSEEASLGASHHSPHYTTSSDQTSSDHRTASNWARRGEARAQGKKGRRGGESTKQVAASIGRRGAEIMMHSIALGG